MSKSIKDNKVQKEIQADREKNSVVRNERAKEIEKLKQFITQMATKSYEVEEEIGIDTLEEVMAYLRGKIKELMQQDREKYQKIMNIIETLKPEEKADIILFAREEFELEELELPIQHKTKTSKAKEEISEEQIESLYKPYLEGER